MDPDLVNVSELLKPDPNQLLAVYDCDPVLARQIADQWTVEDPYVSPRCLYVARRVIATDNIQHSLRELGSMALRTLGPSTPTTPSAQAPSRE